MPYYDDDYSPWSAQDTAIMERLAADPNYGRITDYDVGPAAQSFIERQGLEQQWINPYDLGLTIPSRLTEEEKVAEATKIATAEEGLPPGYMRDAFGNLVKTPPWYVPPPKEGTGTISVGPGMPSRPPAPGYVWDERIVTATGERYWVQEWVGYGPGTTLPTGPMTKETAQTMVDELNKVTPGLYILGPGSGGGYAPVANPNYKPPTPQGQTYPTYDEASKNCPKGYRPLYNPSTGMWGYEAYDPISPYQEASMNLQREQQQQMIGWYNQQQQAELGAQKEQRLATLRANPQSWLEYASLAGQQPAIQPWMLPLMPQQYAGTVAGAPIPGWSKGAPTMAELPELTTPSRQYQARMGPTGVAQYQGYQQARMGQTPEETQFRMWSQAPPGPSYGSLQWQR